MIIETKINDPYLDVTYRHCLSLMFYLHYCAVNISFFTWLPITEPKLFINQYMACYNMMQNCLDDIMRLIDSNKNSMRSI